jgi:hypothetical protein
MNFRLHLAHLALQQALHLPRFGRHRVELHYLAVARLCQLAAAFPLMLHSLLQELLKAELLGWFARQCVTSTVAPADLSLCQEAISPRTISAVNPIARWGVSHPFAVGRAVGRCGAIAKAIDPAI